MFGLPKPPIPPISSILSRFPKPAFFVPDIQPDIVDPVVIWRNEVSISGCNIIISPKKYDVFGQLLEVGAPWLIHNPACKPLINYDPELNRIDAPLPIAGNYALWMVNQQISIWENWAGFKKASFEMTITPTKIEYKEFPGNVYDYGEYALGDYILFDGRKASECFSSEIDGLFKENEQRLPSNARFTKQYSYTKDGKTISLGEIPHVRLYYKDNDEINYSIYRDYPIDRYGNIIQPEFNNRPVVIHPTFFYPVRIVPLDKVSGEFMVIFPAFQMGVSIAASIKISMRTTLNEDGGKFIFDTESDYTGESFFDTYETSYTWDIYKRPGHPNTEANYYREKNEFGNCLILNENYGIRYRRDGFDPVSLFGGGNFTHPGWQCFEFYIPGDWLVKNIDMAGGKRFTWFTSYGTETKEVEVLPPNINIDFNNQSRAGFTIGHIFITQEPESASPNPYAFTDFPIYTSYRHQEDNGFISEQIYYNLENEPPPMNKDNKCCEKQDTRLTAAFKKIRTLETRIAEIEDGDNPATANRLDAIENYINQLDAIGIQLNQRIVKSNNSLSKLTNIVRGFLP